MQNIISQRLSSSCENSGNKTFYAPTIKKPVKWFVLQINFDWLLSVNPFHERIFTEYCTEMYEQLPLSLNIIIITLFLNSFKILKMDKTYMS